MTSSTSPISIPARRRFQRLFVTWLPTVSFVLMSAACVWLLQFQQSSTLIVGEVEVAEFVIASPQTGVVNQILPGLNETSPVYAPVTKGQLLMRLDDATVRIRLDSLQRELLALSQSATVELARVDALTSGATVPVSRKATRTLQADRSATEPNEAGSQELQAWRIGAAVTERQLKEIELVRARLDQRNLAFQISSLAGAPSESAAVKADANRRKADLDLTVARLNTELQFENSSATGSSSNGASSNRGLTSVDESSLSAAGRSLFRSFRRRCQLAQSQLASITHSANSLDVFSPVDGQIDKTHVSQLESVVLGSPVATVVPNRGNVVVAFAREQSLLRPFAGMPVTLRSSVDPTQTFSTTVESVGPKFESIPSRLRANPRVEEWGRPVRIRLPKELTVEPGSLLEILFERTTA